MEVSLSMAQRRKKFKGFKVADSFVCMNGDDRVFLLSLSARNSVEKCAKTTQNSLKKCVKSSKTPSEKRDTTQIAKFKVNKNTEIAKFKVDKIAKNAKSSTIKGEYCPKITGCCWDYTQKKKTQKQEEEETKNAA
jgi:hypothetical protein